MNRTEQAQELFNAIDSLRNKITLRRVELAVAGRITAEWPLGDREDVISFISSSANDAGLSETQKQEVVETVKERLDDLASPVTVAMLEGQLLSLQSRINDGLLKDIQRRISEPGKKIENSTNELKIAIDKLDDLNQLFGAVIIAINFVAAIVSARVGKLAPLFSVISQLMLENVVTQNEIISVERPIQLDSPKFDLGIELIEVDGLIRATEARSRFNVTGKGLCVAVCDTGLNSAHVDFEGRILKQVNYTSDNNGDIDDANDLNGHGTHVGGIIVANKDHIGIAPEANIIPLKVLSNAGGGSFDWVSKALTWIYENHSTYNISVVCMSLGGAQNYQSDDFFSDNEIKKKIQLLKEISVVVVIAAGNDFYVHGSDEGMSFPAIVRESVSVGAVYDNVEGAFEYRSGAIAYSTAPDRITPFSQRLHPTTNADCFTDIFAPGAPVTSSGINGPHGESIQQGTSQATPVTCGVILLAQEFYKRLSGNLPEIDDLVDWIRVSGVIIKDGDDESDNVVNTNKDYVRIDAVNLLSHIRRSLEIEELVKANVLQQIK